MMLIIIGALAVSAMILLPGLAEKYIARRLSIHLIKSSVSEKITQYTGLSTRIQGVRFDLFHGLVFSGIRLYPSLEGNEQSYFLHGETVLVDISYWNLIRGRQPYTSVKIIRGKINPYALNLKQWKEVKNRLSDGTDTEKDTAAPERKDYILYPEKYFPQIKTLNLEVENVRIYLPVNNTAGTLKNNDLRLYLTSGYKENSYSGRFKILADSSSEKEASIAGDLIFNSKEQGELKFQYRNLPLSILKTIFFASNIFPDVMSSIPLTTESGLANGNGSLAFLREGLALNTDGQVSDFKIHLRSEDTLFASLFGKIKFNLNTGLNADTGDTAFLKLNAEQPNFNIQFTYENLRMLQKPEPFDKITLKLTSDFQKNIKISPRINSFPGYGKMEMDLNLRYRKNPFLFEPAGNIAFSNFIIEPVFDLARKDHDASFDSLSIESGNISLGANSVLNLKGNFMKGEFNLSALSPLSFSLSKEYLSVFQNWKGSLNVTGLSYQDIVDAVPLYHRAVLKEGSSENAKKAEDLGPVWTFGFTKNLFYSNLIKPFDLNINAVFSQLKDAGSSLPENFRFLFQKKDGLFQMNLQNFQSSAAKGEFFYKLDLERSLPQHDMKLDLSLTDNKLSFQSLIQSQTPPASVSIQYGFGGDGLYTGDMVSRTWSSLMLQMQRADLTELQAVKLASRMLKIDGENFKSSDFTLQRSSEGPYIRLGTVRITSDTLEAYGSGQYLLNAEGNLSMNYTMKDTSQKRGRLSMKILEDESFSPDL